MPRTLVTGFVGPCVPAVPMPHVVAKRAHVAIPVGQGVRAVSMHLVFVPRARVAVPTGPVKRAVPVLRPVRLRAHVDAAFIECANLKPAPQPLFRSTSCARFVPAVIPHYRHCITRFVAPASTTRCSRLWCLGRCLHKVFLI